MISRPHPSVLGRWRLLALLPLVAAALAGAMAPAGAASSRAEAGAGHGPEVGLRPADASDVAREGTDDPFAGRQLYVDPDSDARREAATARERGDERRARLLDRIAEQPQADWFGDWYPTERVRRAVRERVDEVTGAGAYPVLVLYAIPVRDCGGYSGGGLDSSEAYLQWVREVAAGIGRRSAAVVLEPDSLALMDCLSNEQRAERLAVLRTAVAILATGDVAVYLDGGHSDWHPAPEMAARLRSAGVHAARGFALNVVNFRRTDDELAYGRDVSERLGGGHFVVDTSRNGQGPHPGGAWCNPPGRGLGPTPRVSDTGDALADALLWIKRPGESDGECGRGEPEAGAWWPEHALGLASGRHDPGG